MSGEKKQIETKEQAEVFAIFLCSERNRHVGDIRMIEADLIRLKRKWDIVIPWDARYFFET